MIKPLKKEVYIPIEIKPREFVSQLLLSGELARMGLRVYLGSKGAIDNLISYKRKKNGVYLYKGGGGSINKFKSIAKHVESIAVLDQEITPRDYEINIKNRFVKGSLKYVSSLYYIGFEAKKAATKILENVKPSQIKAFGWPRVELWKPSLNHVWNDQVKDIKSRFPDPYIFFCSDFGTNTQNLVEERCIQTEKRGRKKTKEDIEWFRNDFTNHYNNFIDFIEFLSILNEDNDIPNIIIRPHPAEDHSAWQKKVKDLSKVHIIYEGCVSPWLLASEGLLHRGCTTSIEAIFSRKKVAFLSNFSAKNVDSITYKISPEIKDINSLKAWITEDTEDLIDNTKTFNNLKKHINFSDNNAVSLIAKDLFKLSGKSVPPSHIYKKNKIKLAFINLLVKLINKIYKKPNYIPKLPKSNKMQNGIKLSECEEYLSLMYPNFNYDLEETNPDLIKIE